MLAILHRHMQTTHSGAKLEALVLVKHGPSPPHCNACTVTPNPTAL